jgi:hypothetical protein
MTFDEAALKSARAVLATSSALNVRGAAVLDTTV